MLIKTQDLFEITLTDGTVLKFANSNEPFTGYTPKPSLMEITQNKQNGNLAIDTTSIIFYNDRTRIDTTEHEGITLAQAVGLGLFDGAKIKIRRRMTSGNSATWSQGWLVVSGILELETATVQQLRFLIKTSATALTENFPYYVFMPEKNYTVQDGRVTTEELTGESTIDYNVAPLKPSMMVLVRG